MVAFSDGVTNMYSSPPLAMLGGTRLLVVSMDWLS